MGYGAYLAAQTYLAESYKLLVYLLVHDSRIQRHSHGQVACGLVQTESSDDIQVHVKAAHEYPKSFFKDCDYDI